MAGFGSRRHRYVLCVENTGYDVSLDVRRIYRVIADSAAAKRRMLRDVSRDDPLLSGRKVLIVDDDMRNIFALTSALEPYGVRTVFAENGRDGIQILDQDPEIEIVLMDIMMPEMDGFETIRHIRGDDRFRSIPIIALTAKAMKGDRERCLEAGASEYITKPVDIDHLLSLLRVAAYPIPA